MSRTLEARLGLIPAICALAAGVCSSQGPSVYQEPQRLEITLERKQGPDWKAVDPRLVLEPGDRVRFRARTSFAGYLYVMNHSSSGRYSLLFPGEETGRDNRVEAGREFLMPAGTGWFRISGPPGHEIVYWLVSPVELPGQEGESKPDYVPLPPPPKPGRVRPGLIPRCDETIWRARGDCVDTSAGVRALPEPATMPENLARIRGAASRDLVFVRQQNSSVVASPARLTGPAVFQFRLAHK